jgi:hypothetical protein
VRRAVDIPLLPATIAVRDVDALWRSLDEWSGARTTVPIHLNGCFSIENPDAGLAGMGVAKGAILIVDRPAGSPRKGYVYLVRQDERLSARVYSGAGQFKADPGAEGADGTLAKPEVVGVVRFSMMRLPRR